MFKAFKYIFLAHLYRKAKKSFILLGVSIFLLFLVSFIVNDLLNVAVGMSLYALIMIKWLTIFSFLGLATHSILKIINAVTNPFQTDSHVTSPIKSDQANKKKRILEKEKLYTKNDLIIQKYKKDSK